MEDVEIKEGFRNLRDSAEYDNLFAAGAARAKADWLVGMNATRLFTCRFGSMLNIGRVQTPTLAMVVKRDSDVKNFVKQKFFTVQLDCGEFAVESERIDDEAKANELTSLCDGKTAVISEATKEQKSTKPPKLYDLTTLQREANRIFAKTMYNDGDSQFKWNDGHSEWENIRESILSGETEYIRAWLYEAVPGDFRQEIDNLREALDHYAVTYFKGQEYKNRQALYSIEQGDEIFLFKAPHNCTAEDILKIAGGNEPYAKLMEFGERIYDEGNYAAIQHSEQFTFLVDLNLDTDAAQIYEVNGGKGGIVQSDRTDDNIRLSKIKISEFMQNKRGEKEVAMSDFKRKQDGVTAEGELTAVRVGDFYEFYGEDAELAAELLNINLTSRHGEPMTGFPVHILEQYESRLYDKGYELILREAEELSVEPPAPAKGKYITEYYVCNEYGDPISDAYETWEEADRHLPEFYPEADYVDGFDTLIDVTAENSLEFNIRFTESGILRQFLDANYPDGNIPFALANELIRYLDEKAVTLSYAEVKALCAGNPLIKEKMDLDIEVAKLKVLKSNYNSQRYSLEDKIIKEYPRQISVLEKRIEAYGKDLEHMRTIKEPDEGISMMVVAGKPYTDKEAAGEALASALKVVKSTTDKYNIGSFKGFDMYLSYNSFSRQFTLDLKREGTHSVVLGDSNAGNITRIENALNSIEKRIEGSKEQLKTVREQREEAKAELAKPFAREQELTDKLTRLAQLNAELNIDGAGKSEISADEKPSVLGEISNLKKQAKEKDKGIGKKPERDDTDKKDGRQAI